MLEECRKKLDRLPSDIHCVTENLLNAADDYGYEEGGGNTEEVYINALEDFVCCLEKDLLEEGLTRKSCN